MDPPKQDLQIDTKFIINRTQIQNFSIIIKYVKINHFIHETIKIDEIFNDHYIKLIFQFHTMISIKKVEIIRQNNYWGRHIYKLKTFIKVIISNI